MNDTIVPSLSSSPQNVLAALTQTLEEMAPQVRKAATHILENPNDVGISSIREVAEAADVKPNTLVRMARQVGFDGYEDFREPFRAEIRAGATNFPDRARWLQSVRKKGQMGELYASMVSAAIANIEQTFAGINETDLRTAADVIWRSRRTFTLGVGVNSSNAQNFTYLATTGMVDFHAIPRLGSTPADDLAWADKRDVLIAIGCKPYRREVLEGMAIAKKQGVTIIGISDSIASPVLTGAQHRFVIAVDTPQFFTSSVSTIALLETLLSFVIAAASPKVVGRVEKIHQWRHDLGIYQEMEP